MPTVLLLEDIHWLDDDTKKYLPALLRSMAMETDHRFSFAVFASARSDEPPLFIEGIHQVEIQLNQLDRSAIAQLATDHLDGPPGDSLIDLLLERSEGNPFYAEELLRYLNQHKLINCLPDGCVVISDQTDTLPENIGALLVARLDHLMQEVKEVVQTAAVLGREFDLDLLSHMLSETKHTAECIRQAEQAAILTALSTTRYIFRHALMRDAAYNMLVMTLRKEFHQLAVNAIETVYRDHLELHYGELAYHSYQAELFDKACLYYRRAATAAQQAYQNELALQYNAQALDLTPADALEDRFDLLLQQTQLYNRLGMVDGRKICLTNMGQLTDQMEDRTKKVTFLLETANLQLDTDAYEDAIHTASQAIDLAESLADDTQTAHGYRFKGTALFRMGDYQEAEKQLRISQDYADRVNDPQLRSNVLSNLGLIYLDQEKIDLAVEAFSDALQSVQKQNLLSLQAGYLNNLAQAIGLQGDFHRAQAYFQQSLDLIRKIGARRDEGLVLGNLGWIAASLGDYRTAYAYHLENLKLNRRIRHRFIEAIAMINLSAAACALGNFSEAVSWGEQALALTREIINRNGEAWALTYLGHAYLAQEQYHEAAEAYRAALVIRNHLEQNILATEPLAGLAQAAYASGNMTEAYRFIEPIVTLLEEGSALEGTDEPMRIYAACHRVLNALGDERANRILNKGYAALQARAAQINDKMIKKQFLENIPHNRYIQTEQKKKNRPADAEPV